MVLACSTASMQSMPQKVRAPSVPHETPEHAHGNLLDGGCLSQSVAIAVQASVRRLQKRARRSVSVQKMALFGEFGMVCPKLWRECTAMHLARKRHDRDITV